VSAPRIVLVEDDDSLRAMLGRELAENGFRVEALAGGDGLLELCQRHRPQVALVDLKLRGQSGLEVLRELKQAFDALQVVMLTGHGGVPEAVEAMRLGAYDFLLKPAPLEELERVLRHAAEKNDLLLENLRLRRAAATVDPDAMLGESAAMEELRRLVARIGPVEAAVLVEGENGSGKEIVARNLHRASARSDRPFVVLNCAAVPRELVESELFGHERGAFTGADRPRVGLFEAAHEGTLFLDEVGELPPAVQPALLRALQFGEVRAVGSTRTRNVDVRIVAATNRDLRKETEEGRFREDLFYRLATFEIRVPPLRERPDDIPLLAREAMARACAQTGRALVLGEDALERLRQHPWKGNVRELQNAVLRLCALSRGEIVTAADVETIALGSVSTGKGTLPTLRIDELERMATEAAVARHPGDRKAAAEALGISLRTLYNKLREYGLN